MEEESTGDVIQIVRPAAVQKDRPACTAAQTLAGQNHMNKKADTPNCEWGGRIAGVHLHGAIRWYKIEKNTLQIGKKWIQYKV